MENTWGINENREMKTRYIKQSEEGLPRKTQTGRTTAPEKHISSKSKSKQDKDNPGPSLGNRLKGHQDCAINQSYVKLKIKWWNYFSQHIWLLVVHIVNSVRSRMKGCITRFQISLYKACPPRALGVLCWGLQGLGWDEDDALQPTRFTNFCFSQSSSIFPRFPEFPRKILYEERTLIKSTRKAGGARREGL